MGSKIADLRHPHTFAVKFVCLFLAVLGCTLCTRAQSAAPPNVDESDRTTYVLGPGDELSVSAIDVQELGKEPYRVALDGNLTIPLAGSIPATGLTIEQITAAISGRLSKYVKSPQVTVGLLEMRSQPVSVLGEVRNPGVVQLMGQKSLFEVLSLAGGLNPEAGNAIRLTREKQWGAIPLADAKADETGDFWVAEIGVKEILEGSSPEKNIAVKPNDVITVPKGEIVYVLGAVKKSGGFVLGARDRVTVLQALAMAEGLDHFANTANAKIVRKTDAANKPLEIHVDVGKLLRGKTDDITLADNDILFVPVSGTKQAISRTVEAGFNIGTGIAIWRP
jgi:polysaccharide biosynthesis/export protein